MSFVALALALGRKMANNGNILTFPNTSLVSRRSMSSSVSSVSSSDPKQVISEKSRNFEVPVPWGKLAGKEWGDPNGPPWIVLHGWLDNCGSFDLIAPLFPQHHRLICFDLPGHGFSSHGPPGLHYHYLDGLQYIRRVARHFNLGQFSLMGHSMGGGIASIFASTHPEMVSRLILLDIIKPVTRKNEKAVSRTRASVDELLAFEEKMDKGKNPSYSYDEAKTKLIQASLMHGEDAITEKSADILLKRGLIPDPEGGENSFVYSRDIRHRIASLYQYPQDVLVHYAMNIKCPFLVVKALKGPYYEKKELAEEILEVYRTHNKNFVYAEVEGNHHVHLNTPELAMEPIKMFLEKFDLKSANL